MRCSKLRLQVSSEHLLVRTEVPGGAQGHRRAGAAGVKEVPLSNQRLQGMLGRRGRDSPGGKTPCTGCAYLDDS